LARHRTPTEILATRASPVARSADRQNEPAKNGALEKSPPAHLKPAVAKCWTAIVDAAPFGVLWAADALIVEIGAELLAEFRKNPAGMSASRLARLQSVLSMCALTPTDRSRVLVVAAPRLLRAARDPSGPDHSHYFIHDK